jgi:hypothetical protein
MSIANNIIVLDVGPFEGGMEGHRFWPSGHRSPSGYKRLFAQRQVLVRQRRRRLERKDGIGTLCQIHRSDEIQAMNLMPENS